MIREKVTGKSRLRLDLSGEHDDMIALELASSWGRPVTEVEVVEHRRDAVRLFRQMMAKYGQPLDELRDLDVYHLMSRALVEG